MNKQLNWRYAVSAYTFKKESTIGFLKIVDLINNTEMCLLCGILESETNLPEWAISQIEEVVKGLSISEDGYLREAFKKGNLGPYETADSWFNLLNGYEEHSIFDTTSYVADCGDRWLYFNIPNGLPPERVLPSIEERVRCELNIKGDSQLS